MEYESEPLLSYNYLRNRSYKDKFKYYIHIWFTLPYLPLLPFSLSLSPHIIPLLLASGISVECDIPDRQAVCSVNFLPCLVPAMFPSYHLSSNNIPSLLWYHINCIRTATTNTVKMLSEVHQPERYHQLINLMTTGVLGLDVNVEVP